MKPITSIDKLEKKITPDMEDKYLSQFEKQARYRGNGVYNISGTNLFSTDTRDLFLMFIAAKENIPYNPN